MQFNSVDFMIFFPIVLAVYFVVPRKARKIWLLTASYYSWLFLARMPEFPNTINRNLILPVISRRSTVSHL